MLNRNGLWLPLRLVLKSGIPDCEFCHLKPLAALTELVETQKEPLRATGEHGRAPDQGGVAFRKPARRIRPMRSIEKHHRLEALLVSNGVTDRLRCGVRARKPQPECKVGSNRGTLHGRSRAPLDSC